MRICILNNDPNRPVLRIKISEDKLKDNFEKFEL